MHTKGVALEATNAHSITAKATLENSRTKAKARVKAEVRRGADQPRELLKVEEGHLPEPQARQNEENHLRARWTGRCATTTRKVNAPMVKTVTSGTHLPAFTLKRANAKRSQMHIHARRTASQRSRSRTRSEEKRLRSNEKGPQYRTRRNQPMQT